MPKSFRCESEILFDEQLIKYRLKVSYNDTNDGIITRITYPDPIVLKNEKRLEALQDAVILKHDGVIGIMLKLSAKDGKAIHEVNSVFKNKVHFDSLDTSNNRNSFHFNGLVIAPGAKVNIDTKTSNIAVNISMNN